VEKQKSIESNGVPNSISNGEKGGSECMKRKECSIGRLAAAALMFALLSGCASMFAPANDTIKVNSVPEGAKVYDGANLLGTTPLTQTFKRSTFEHKTLSVRKEGYKTQEVPLGTVLDSAALWNFGFFITTMGVTSWGTDATSGNMVKYHPDSYLIELEKEGGAKAPKERADFERLRFVASNQDFLQQDIARGDGEYLKAYFEIRPQERAPGEYATFLRGVSREAPHLLSLNDPVEFYKSLEVI
jgi:hypothetical protein